MLRLCENINRTKLITESVSGFKNNTCFAFGSFILVHFSFLTWFYRKNELRVETLKACRDEIWVRITLYHHLISIPNHFTLHSSSWLPWTADINWETLETQRAISGAFICSSAPRTVPIKADNVIIKRADRQELSARHPDLATSAVCYTSQITMLPPLTYDT